MQEKSAEANAVKQQLESLKCKASEEEPDLKFKGNKKQRKFNLYLRNRFDQILKRVDASSKIQDLARESTSMINERNKLIAIADRDGWDVVESQLLTSQEGKK